MIGNMNRTNAVKSASFNTLIPNAVALDIYEIFLTLQNDDEDRFVAGMSMQITHEVPTKVINEFTKYLLKDITENEDHRDTLCNTFPEMISNWDEETWMRVHQRYKPI
jgi:hypothetical protein